MWNYTPVSGSSLLCTLVNKRKVYFELLADTASDLVYYQT